MSYGAMDKRVDEVLVLLNRAIANNFDNAETELSDDTVKNTIRDVIKSKDNCCISGIELNLACDKDYYIVFLQDEQKFRVTDFKDVLLSKMEADYKVGASEGDIVELKDVCVIWIVNDCETSALVDVAWRDMKAELRKGIKVLTNHKKFIVNRNIVYCAKKHIKTYEINNIDRYSVLQEPELINRINFEKWNDESSSSHKTNLPTGYVVTAKLIELIKLYNIIGDSLFDNNVRYGIGEKLGVDEAIRNTLKNEGETFWYRNNGVTILVKSNDFKLEYPNKIVFGDKDSFSVINGAQTITVASSFYYSILALKKSNSSIDKTSEYKSIIESINKAKVLLRIICVGSDVSDGISVGNEISVALNRQKPISIEDIAYTLDYIRDFDQFMNSYNDDKRMFKLCKRGVIKSDNVLDLSDFSKARYACCGDPNSARNVGLSTSLKSAVDDKGEFGFANKTVFPSLNDPQDVMRYFGAIVFVNKLSREYEALKPSICSNIKDESVITYVKNAKWLFISHVVKLMNNGDVNDFSSFDYDDSIFHNEHDLVQVISDYFIQVDEVSRSKNYTEYVFKNRGWYKDMLENVDLEVRIFGG